MLFSLQIYIKALPDLKHIFSLIILGKSRDIEADSLDLRPFNPPELGLNEPIPFEAKATVHITNNPIIAHTHVTWPHFRYKFIVSGDMIYDDTDYVLQYIVSQYHLDLLAVTFPNGDTSLTFEDECKLKKKFTKIYKINISATIDSFTACNTKSYKTVVCVM